MGRPVKQKILTTDVNTCTVKDICHIIKMCCEAGVSKLKFGDLEVEFMDDVFSQATAEFTQPKVSYPANTGLTENKAYQSDTTNALPVSNAQRHPDVGEQLVEEMRFAQLMIEDPLAYEQQIADQHLGANEIGAYADRDRVHQPR